MLEGNLNSRILFVSDFQRSDEAFFNTTLSDQRRQILVGALNRAGIPESEYAFTIIYPWQSTDSGIFKESQEKKIEARLACKKLINESGANVIVPLGEHALNFITGLEGIQNHKCTVLKVKAEFGARKAIPLPHPEQIQKQWEDHAYISFGCQRLASEYHSKELASLDRKFLLSLDLSFEQICDELDLIASAFEVSVDFETGRNQINTVGFSTGPEHAIAIDVLPTSHTVEQFHIIWGKIKTILEDDSLKIMQNGIYESQWASLYGIDIKNISFDTMIAMKMLHPTLDKGLDNVGRLYTNRPYWKGSHSDWNNIRNWRSHLTYNCDDTSGTFEAKINLERALHSKGLLERFDSYMKHIYPVNQRMTNQGLLVSGEKLEMLKTKLEQDLLNSTENLDRQTEAAVGRKINPNSPKQVKELLKELKIKIPTKKGSETVNKDALKKLRKSNPDELIIADLIKISTITNEIETYFNFKYDADSRVRFSVDMFHDEHGEMKTSKNPFGCGFSLDGVPRKTKGFIVADPECELLEISLYKPEQTYLAYDSGDSKMIGMIQRNEDIPQFLASKMFNKPASFIHPFSAEYRIAESALYAAAYGMGPRSFAIKAIAETDKSISEIESKRFMSIIFEYFPRLRKRQEDIQYALRHSRTLVNPLGSSITYYDRFNDDLFKRAYEWGFRSLQADLLKALIIENSAADIKAVTSDAILLQIKGSENTISADHFTLNGKFGKFIIQKTFKQGASWGGLQNV